MNGHTLVRMRTLFGTDEGHEDLGERHVALEDIPAELTWQAHRCHLNGDIEVVKLTIALEVEQPPRTPKSLSSTPSTACST